MRFRYNDEFVGKQYTFEVPDTWRLVPGSVEMIKIPGNKEIPCLPVSFLSNPRFESLGVKILSEVILADDCSRA